jgi:hypothetical protein
MRSRSKSKVEEKLICLKCEAEVSLELQFLQQLQQVFSTSLSNFHHKIRFLPKTMYYMDTQFSEVSVMDTLFISFFL